MSKLVYRLPPDLTKVDLKALVLAVKEIQNLLSPPPTKEELEEALNTAGELNELDYTQQSWQELATAVLEGNQVLEAVDATQEQIDDATQDINIAIDNLVEWTPAEEFSNGEQGVWFDPSDLTTLYQDSRGQTPVTGSGQPVGLMLDKSQGLELGPEQSTDYDSGDWYATGSSPNQWQIDSANVVSVDNTGGTINSLMRSNNLGMVDGKTYRIEFEILTSNGIGGVRLTNATDNFSPAFLSTGPVSVIFKAGGTNVGIFGLQAYPDWVGSIGNISVKELPGHHAIQPTTAAKPTYSDVNGLGFDGVDDLLIVGTVDDFIWLHDGSPVTIGLVREVLPNNAQQQIVGTAHLGASALIGLSVVSETREVNARFGYDGFTIAHGETGFYTYRLSSTSVDASDSQVATITYQYDSAIARTYVNGVLGSTAVPDSLSFSDSPSTYPLHIGSSGNGAQLLGNVKALVIYNKHLTPEAFERFQHWLAKKAGITL